MSVPQWKQTASQLDAYNESVKLRHIVTEMIMRDFGLKLPERQYEIHVGQQLRKKYPELAGNARVRRLRAEGEKAYRKYAKE